MKKIDLIKLKKLKLNTNITKRYQKWMNDPEVHQFTEQGKKKHTLNDIRNFVKEKNNSKNEFLFGIFLKKKSNEIHIGNIKLGPINLASQRADISYFIGEKKLWGKGYTTIAIKQIIKFAKKKKLKNIQAGADFLNYGSHRVLIKSGFKIKKKLKLSSIYLYKI